MNEIVKMLVASTGNVSKATADMIDQTCDACLCEDATALDIHENAIPVVFRKGEYGWIVNVITFRKELYPDMPADLDALMEVAAKEGCEWIMLDRDGDLVDDLPSYDW